MIQASRETDGSVSATQFLTVPTVYLDHWALRLASRDERLDRRLTQALHAAGGTLAISWANVAEFSELDAEAARLAENVIDQQSPHLFFLDFNPFDVVRREDAVIAGGTQTAPHADPELFGLVITQCNAAAISERPASTPPLSCRGMLSEVSGRRNLSTERMKAAFVAEVSAWRSEYLSDAELRRIVDRWPKSAGEPRGTLLLLREIVAGLLRDKTAPLAANDALDFFHTVVPAAYCDFVLLDGRWRDLVDRVRVRLGKAGVTLPIATVFDGSRAIENLIDALERTTSGGAR